MTQTVAFLAGGALLAFAIATLLAGRSLWFVTRTVIGWSAAVLAVVLAFAAFALVGFHYLTDQAPTTAVSGALGVGGALIVIGVAAKATRRRRKPARAPIARAAFTAPHSHEKAAHAHASADRRGSRRDRGSCRSRLRPKGCGW